MAEIRLQQKQQLQFSAQQILSSQLLQLPMQNLEQRIYEELQENPLLELVDEQRESASEGNGESDRQIGDDMFDSVERFSKSSLKEHSEVFPSGETSEGRLNYTHESPSKERFFQAVQHDSFHDILLKQLALHEDIKEREVKIAIEILGNLDGDGYFTEGHGVIIDSLHFQELDVREGELEAIRRKILFLDPPGVAACNLQERLLVQLQVASSRYDARTVELANRLLNDHFDDFLHRRFELLIKKLGVAKERVESAVSAIIALDPHPGIFQDMGGHYITPDFVVTYENGELTAALNDRSSLSVKVTDRYQELLKNRKAPKEEKQFIRQNIQRANEFTNALATRRQTLLKVIEALMKHQYVFFISGPEHVMPLGMKTIAAETGLDISTISRAVNGKYVQTRFGLFELKYFFSVGLSREDGDDLSSKIIRQYIADMIRDEDAAHPLSDDSLAEMLVKRGIHIARRTVAKYREQMQIPVARLRKKIF
ncbi:MAG: RNA polymerase factor sigma-54 [Chlorobium sp.]|nr:MAG: RNA polymerase factor sigma-54 [Chlorobium sp.]